jgi:hypothetical protein
MLWRAPPLHFQKTPSGSEPDQAATTGGEGRVDVAPLGLKEVPTDQSGQFGCAGMRRRSWRLSGHQDSDERGAVGTPRFSVKMIDALPPEHASSVEVFVEQFPRTADPVPVVLWPQTFAFFTGTADATLCGTLKKERGHGREAVEVGKFSLALKTLPFGRDILCSAPVVGNAGINSLAFELCAFNWGVPEERGDGETTVANPASSLAQAVVDVEILEARDLPAMDRGVTSDPYCICSYGNKSYRTPISWKCLNVKWTCQDCSFWLDDDEALLKVCQAVYARSVWGSCSLQFMMWDRDAFNDDYLGGCVIDLKQNQRFRSHLRLLQPR